jgi:hypothetical protein
MPYNNDIILTGVPRSGTTLACYLLNKLANVVALHEPMEVWRLADLANDRVRCNTVVDFFSKMRQSLLTQGLAVSKQVAGEVPDNPVSELVNPEGLRETAVSLGQISVGKNLDKDFTLVVKHPAAFTAMLNVLVKRFRCYAIIRNPLAVLASWNSVALPVEQGHAPIAEALDSVLRAELSRRPDKFDRQVCLLNWYFDQYYQTLPAASILRYEEVVVSEGRALKRIVPCAEGMAERLNNNNNSAAYDGKAIRAVGSKLLASEGTYWRFYKRETVAALLEKARAPRADQLLATGGDYEA